MQLISSREFWTNRAQDLTVQYVFRPACALLLLKLILPQEMANHIFQTCYNLCRLNKTRQEEAAQAGIIPSLMRVIESSSPLKQFALPILCDLASAGKSCRKLLWQHDGLGVYVKLLSDPYFQVSALEAIHSWLVFALLFDDVWFIHPTQAARRNRQS